MSEFKFWTVWRDGGGAPTVRHHSLYAASQEAMRLVKGTPSVRFFVMESIGSYSTPPHQIVWTPTDKLSPRAHDEIAATKPEPPFGSI